jgi:hypothetical protein
MPTPHSSLEAPGYRPSPLHSCFQTIDTDVAAYLYSRAYELLRTDQAGESLIFTFPAEAALGAEAFYQGATACAKSLLYAARQLEKMRTNKVDDHHSA